MSTTSRYLVIRSDQTMRVTVRRPRLRYDEIAYRFVVKFPDGWGRVANPGFNDEIMITLPDNLPSAPEVDVEPFTGNEHLGDDEL